MAEFKQITPDAIADNVFDLIGKHWMLITAGNETKFNTMTASWGGMGVLWGRNVTFCFVRPQRYTFGFMEQSDTYTLSFYDESYRQALNFCGSKSGRDFDKAKETGLTPVFSDGTVYFEQARLVLICKKLSAGFLRPESFTDPIPGSCYPEKDYHKAYVGDIVKILTK